MLLQRQMPESFQYKPFVFLRKTMIVFVKVIRKHLQSCFLVRNTNTPQQTQQQTCSNQEVSQCCFKVRLIV